MATTTAAPVEVFVSYSHEDDQFRKKLGKHLSLLKRQNVINEWHDRLIDAGEEWADEIDERLDSAALILLLVSTDFIASDYCYEREMKRALERHDAGSARVIPVILREVDNWQAAPFGRLQALPEGGKPISAWPDEDVAFADVTRGIRRVVEGLQSQRRQGLPAIWNVPFLRNPHFTGRDELLDELHENLTKGRVTLTAVHGMGGVGKTQLALEYTYRHAGDFDLVWWLRAEAPATVLEDYAALAGPLGVGKAGEGDLAALADTVRETLGRRDGWFLVFDNATGPDDVTPLLPRPGVGRVLITSRNPSWPRALPLDVPVLSREAAIGFLLEQTGQDNRGGADALARELGDLPLALAQAAAYMRAAGTAFADYLDLFRTRRRELWAEEKPPPDYPATVGTALATDRLRADEPLAVDLLSLCAFLAPEAIPRRLLAEHHESLPADLGAAVAEPLHLNRLVAGLRRYSLVEVTGDALSFHRLVQARARDALTSDEHRHWVEAAVALMHAAFPYDRDDPATWVPSGALLAHALAAAGHAERTAKDLAHARWLLNQTARYFETRAEFEVAKAGFGRALALAEVALGLDDPEVAIYVNNLGDVLQALGDLAGARAAFERSLRILEKFLPADHPNIATARENLRSVTEQKS